MPNATNRDHKRCAPPRKKPREIPTFTGCSEGDIGMCVMNRVVSIPYVNGASNSFFRG